MSLGALQTLITSNWLLPRLQKLLGENLASHKIKTHSADAIPPSRSTSGYIKFPSSGIIHKGKHGNAPSLSRPLTINHWKFGVALSSPKKR